MITGNGKPPLGELQAIFRRIEELEQAELDRAQAQLVETEVAARLAEKMAELQPPLHRSQMSAAEISRYIRSHPDGPAAGAAEFSRLPK
jgi:dsRNA-specific ribonuclease